MLQYIIKIVVSAVLITVISEISKRSSFMGGVLASVPFLSLIVFIWLYVETKSLEKISQLSTSVFWLVIPSLSVFLILPKLKLDFYLALTTSIIAMIMFYYAMILILAKFGVKI